MWRATVPNVTPPARTSDLPARIDDNERWLADFPNDLRCLSLTCDGDITSMRRDELALECDPDRSRQAEHLHADCGI